MTIGIIGAGTMGKALARAFLRKKIVLPDQIQISDPDEAKFQSLQKKYRVRGATNNLDVINGDFIFLAVKPQQFSLLARELKGKIPQPAIVISIMAGISIKTLEKKLQHRMLVRAMPNTPAVLGYGVTGWFAVPQIAPTKKNMIKKILGTTGIAIELKSESQIDELTVVSGCGPGFFFVILYYWAKAMKFLKLPQEKKTIALIKTLQGSLKLLEKEKKDPLDLAKQVMSKGGATEQGVFKLNKANLEKIFSDMLRAAYNKCKLLSRTK